MTTPATTPDDPSLISGKKFFLFGGLIFLAFATAAILLARLRVQTKPAIDLCNRVGIQLERTAGAALSECQKIPLTEPVPDSFRPVEEPGITVTGARGFTTCAMDHLEYSYRFSATCEGMKRDVRLRVSLPPKDLTQVRDDIRPGVVEACQAVMEMNCDCRQQLGIPAGGYARNCEGIERDRAAGR